MQTISVFVENCAGSAQKHVFDEKRRVLQSVQPVSRPYPYAYGFVLDTSAADGDNLDCFVLTERQLASGEVVECSVLGLMEQLEDGLVDHNLLAVPLGEAAEVTPAVQTVLREFVTHVFDHIPGKVVLAGRFLDVNAASTHLAACRD
jgi:inorganic pyrophosphatase